MLKMNIVVFDLETQQLFEEVGGRDPGLLRMSCGVTWSSVKNDYSLYWEKDVQSLISELKVAGRVVGFNLRGFDYEVLKAYSPGKNLGYIPTLDIMEDLSRTLSFRLSLEAVARGTLDEAKSADGLQAVTWWKSGNLDLLADYCRRDVEVTKRIYEFGCENGFVRYTTRFGSVQKVKVNWKC
jgi:DEAD/DEAH box helicase domain-containing protein